MATLVTLIDINDHNGIVPLPVFALTLDDHISPGTFAKKKKNLLIIVTPVLHVVDCRWEEHTTAMAHRGVSLLMLLGASFKQCAEELPRWTRTPRRRVQTKPVDNFDCQVAGVELRGRASGSLAHAILRPSCQGI